VAAAPLDDQSIRSARSLLGPRWLGLRRLGLRRLGLRRLGPGLLVGLALSLAGSITGACASSATAPGDDGAGGTATGTGASGPGGFGVGGSGGGEACGCLPGPHQDRIYTVSASGEIWSYHPETNEFQYATTLLCQGLENPFSMGIDQAGMAWVLSADNGLVYLVDPAAPPGECEVSPFIPKQAGYDLFGMAFVGGLTEGCPPLYSLSYSGQGPFAEGPGLGELARIDPESGSLTPLASIDFDGGELAGTANGRLYAFAGVNPVKLVEYDPSNGAELMITPLDGFSKTNASAFAFYAGDVYFFTEAIPACASCLEATCDADITACEADPSCAAQLQCALDQGGISDTCGGFLPQPVIDCLSGPCLDDCFVASSIKISKVTRLDLDGNDGGGLEVMLEEAPIRVVGAGSSICVPQTPF
jgi:hypothetical protein